MYKYSSGAACARRVNPVDFFAHEHYESKCLFSLQLMALMCVQGCSYMQFDAKHKPGI